MRCDKCHLRILFNYARVSIHTPTWGVTKMIKTIADDGSVSIHTPTWGVTSEELSFPYPVYVSIHTPTWGVTSLIKSWLPTKSFQSTHLHEVWLCYNFYNLRSFVFQSTHLHEVWLLIFLIVFIIISFNPHTYMRCDRGRSITTRWCRSFNPHTYMRCDEIITKIHRLFLVSIHTPTWGVTLV